MLPATGMDAQPFGSRGRLPQIAWASKNCVCGGGGGDGRDGCRDGGGGGGGGDGSGGDEAASVGVLEALHTAAACVSHAGSS